MDYIIHIIILSGFYSVLAQSLNLFSGNTGLISLTHAGFYGLGAYGTAILTKDFGVPFILSTFLTLGMITLLSLLISKIAFRTKDDYFVIITLSLQMVVFLSLNNLTELTHGPIGIINIEKIPLVEGQLEMLILVMLITIFSYYIIWRISKSSWGMNLRAIKEDELLLQTLGKDVVAIKTYTFILSALFASIIGVLYSHYIGYIDPTSFTLAESVLILTIVIVGGLGSIHGSILAAFFMISIPEILRFVSFESFASGNARQILYGLSLIVAIYLREMNLEKNQQ